MSESRFLYPAILTNSPTIAQQQLSLVNDDKRLSVVQIDIIDGEFVDNTTLYPHELAELDYGQVQADMHLLTQEPLDMVHELIETLEISDGGIPVRSVIGQVERMSYQLDFVEEVRKNGWGVGLSLDLFTPVSEVESSVWEQLDIIQVMGNEAGFQGKSLHPLALKKVAEVRAKLDRLGLDAELIVDVGVKIEVLPSLLAAGTQSVSVGSGLWEAESFVSAVDEFTKILGYNGV